MITDNTQRENIWKKKTILREAYKDIFITIKKNMSKVSGINLEIGSGFGIVKDYIPDIITSDVLPADNLDLIADATKLPYEDSQIANVIMLDVFHHVESPVKLLNELTRVLKPHGRIIMVEPYPSLVSLPVYRLLHDEPFNFNEDVFKQNDFVGDKNPWESNQAIPYLFFFKHQKNFDSLFAKKLSLVKKDTFSLFLYPLSGGYSGKQLAPDFAIPILRIFEKILAPLRYLLAFRCLIVLEKIDQR